MDKMGYIESTRVDDIIVFKLGLAEFMCGYYANIEADSDFKIFVADYFRVNGLTIALQAYIEGIIEMVAGEKAGHLWNDF